MAEAPSEPRQLHYSHSSASHSWHGGQWGDSSYLIIHDDWCFWNTKHPTRIITSSLVRSWERKREDSLFFSLFHLWWEWTHSDGRCEGQTYILTWEEVISEEINGAFVWETEKEVDTQRQRERHNTVQKFWATPPFVIYCQENGK